MTTTLLPTVGNAPLFTQQGVGASPGYSAIDVRRAASAGPIQAGVMGASDFLVIQRAAGANMSVDITMPAGGLACVAGASIGGQGLYDVPASSANVNEVISAAHATLPRIDKVYLRVWDNVHDGSGLNRVETVVSTGTATAAASLANPLGQVLLTGNVLLIGDVLVPAASTTVVTANLRDRRPWARGAFKTILRTTSSYSTSSGTLGELDTTNLKPRIECSGVPLRISLLLSSRNASASFDCIFSLFMDGAEVTGTRRYFTSPAANFAEILNLQWVVVPAAGSHQFAPAFASSGGSVITAFADSTYGLMFTVEELVRQNASND